MTQYEKLVQFQSPDPATLLTFESFKNQKGTEYAPKEFVEFILKCMLYKAQGTYYSSWKEDVENGKSETPLAITRALEFLKTLDNRPAQGEPNLLLKGELSHSTNDKKEKTFKTIIEELQTADLTGEENVVRRLADGYFYIENLYNIIRNSCVNGENEFFIQLLPHKLVVKEVRNYFGFETTIPYPNRESYIHDLREDSVTLKITRDIADPFVPDYLFFLRRNIKISKGASQIERSGDENCFSYQFPDSSLTGNYVREGDWVLCKDSKKLFVILID